MSYSGHYRRQCDACGTETEHRTADNACVLCRIRADKEQLKQDTAARRAEKKAARQIKSKKNTQKRQARYLAKKRKSPEEVTTAKAAGGRAAAEVLVANRQLEAQRELARRELARRHLLPFLQRFEPNYLAGWFHKDLAARLERFSEAVVRGESPRLMLTVPPRHGKSMMASQYFPAWHLGRHPNHEFISASYAQSLQLDFSKKTQEIIRDKEYGILFPGLIIPKGFEAVERWSLARVGAGVQKRTGGGLLAAGVGGPITGRGAHIALIDDPVKNREEADSLVERQKVKDWYSSTLYTRLAPGGGVLIIQTRWHDDDLSGWLLTQMREAERELKETGLWPVDADRWEVVNYPAIATEDEKYRKKGEALHPERYPVPALMKIKRAQTPRDWAALYQQSPVVEEGAYFDKNDFRFYTSPPRDLMVVAAGDLAISKSDDADYTVFVVAGLDSQDNIWILDARRGRWRTNEIVDQMFDIQRLWKTQRFGLEKGHISMTLKPHLELRQRQEKVYSLIVEELPPGKNDKQARARAIQGRMQLGQVKFPRDALWVDEFINEMLRFPNGVNDDRVDAVAWIGRMLAGISYRGKSKAKDKDDSWKKRLKTLVSGNKNQTAMAA